MMNDIKLFGPNQGVFTDYAVEVPLTDSYFRLRARAIASNITEKYSNLPFLIIHPNSWLRWF